MIKLLIVDDSALMRRQLVSVFDAEGDFEIRLARNGKEAVQENIEFMPDVITLDINMPEMDGLTALSLLMEQRPVPVVMVSSLTEKSALATFEALALGAVDYVTKPGGTISLSIEVIKKDLVAKVRSAARSRLKISRESLARNQYEPIQAKRASVAARRDIANEGLVIIGVSTGGPSTLECILPRLPEDFPWPVLVVQHMPASFTGPFANRMNALCPLHVIEVTRQIELEPGTVYIAKGGADIVVTNRGGKLVTMARPENSDLLWHPSVELLGRSVLQYVDVSRVIAVMLTGMGSDGANAFTEIKRLGGRTIAESEESCVVFGMPAELIKLGGASLILDAHKIANQIIVWAQ